MQSRQRCNRGFTFIELCVGLAIAAILFALGMPSYRDWIENSKVRNAAESISSGLMLARSEAVSRNASVDLRLGAGTTSAWVVGCTVANATCPAVIQNREAAEGSSAAITVTSTAGRTISFNNVGRMTLPVPAAPATSIDINVDHNQLTAAQSRDLRITVNIGGSIRMCDPNVIAPDARAC
jgi:type IV fimbrial biogenesis protein FimT